MTGPRALLLILLILQSAVSVTLGLAFIELWRSFRRPLAFRWALAWLAFAAGLLFSMGLGFGLDARAPTLVQVFLRTVLPTSALLFHAGTSSLVDPRHRYWGRFAASCAGLFAATAVLAVMWRSGRLWGGKSLLLFVAPRVFLGAVFAWAAWPLRRVPREQRPDGFLLLVWSLVGVTVRTFAAAGYEVWQVSHGIVDRPESLVLTILQVSLLIAFGLATGLVLIGIERQEAVRASATIHRTAEALRESEAALQHAQRIESLGRMASGVAHDFNNTLSAICGAADLAAEHVHSDHPAAPFLRHIDAAVERGLALTRQLLMFSRRQPTVPERFDARDRVAALVPMLRHMVGPSVVLEVQSGAELMAVRVAPTQFDQVLINLCANARDAMPGGGRATIRLEQVANGASRAPFVQIYVEDTGTGIAADVLPRIFEPFFTTKEVGQGTGLGLASAQGFAQQAGGSLTVETSPAGSCFMLRLPLVTSS